MFGIKTKKIETKISLPQVAVDYVTENTDECVDLDVAEELEKNTQAIGFLATEKSNAFSNEKDIFADKIDELVDTNKLLVIKKDLVAKKTLAAGYPKIDISFMSMKQVSKGELKYHPVFSFHRYTGDGFDDCDIWIRDKNIKLHKISAKNRCIHYNFYTSIAKSLGTLAESIDHLRLSIFGDLVSHGRSFNYIGVKIAKPIAKENVTLHTPFKGIIPSKTKGKIKEASDIFTGNGCSMFLIKECPVWNEEVVTIDPLIIGMIGDDYYLVDHFDTTQIEDYVKKEFGC